MVVPCMTLAGATANVTVSPLWNDHMVLQRGKPIPVYGSAAAGEKVTVTFNDQTRSTTADSLGNWLVSLPAMDACATGKNLTITANNTIRITDVVIGDIWLCSGQSNMQSNLGRKTDMDNANFPGIRQFWVPWVSAGEPIRTMGGSWKVCSPGDAPAFAAVPFYFARKIYQDQNAAIPIGLFVTPLGGNTIDPFLAPEGLTDIPVLHPLYDMPYMPGGPFHLFFGMDYPLVPSYVKGLIWYQGENSETNVQSPDSYFLKEKALAQGWKRAFGLDDFPFYVVLLANFEKPPANATPDTNGWADTRIQQANVLGIPHGGIASATDIGDAGDIHPQDKMDVGERLALWALRNDYGRTAIVPSGPVLRDVTVAGSKAVCAFDYVGAGLMVGSKTLFEPTQEAVGGKLGRFSIAGADGVWHDADATIQGNTVELASPSVATPVKVAYACWMNPAGANLYNKDGLPAVPFLVDPISAKYTITASAGTGGSISPAKATTYLKRKTALYTITPDAGQSIQDVKVDGVSVGSGTYHTFDPIYADHTISATFGTTIPQYKIRASGGPGGTISPTGDRTVKQAGSITFAITPNTGWHASILVDGFPMSARTSFTFTDVRTDHTIAVTFTPGGSKPEPDK
ncbi:MAG: hypothetical protein NTW21_41875 [Verrucomicrobia bacterium]|nr:hypothetical protein [Verrucomicrobiota bacterium]